MAEKAATINRVAAREGEITTLSNEYNSNLSKSVSTERLDMFNGVNIENLAIVFMGLGKIAAEMAVAFIASGIIFCILVCLKFIPSSAGEKSFNNHIISEGK